MKCKICGQDATYEFSINKSRIVGAPVLDEGEMVDYFQCGACGFLFTTFLDDYSAARLNDEIYNAEYWNEIDSEDRSQLPLMFVKRFALGNRKRILSYGCGRGDDVAVLVANGYNAFGYDIATDFKIARRCTNNWKNVPRSFGFVYSFEVLEHLTNPLEFFTRVGGVLKRNGILFFSTSLYDANAGRDYWYLAPRNGHVSILTRKTIDYLCERYHFKYTPLFAGSLHCCVKEGSGPLRLEMIKLRYAVNTLARRITARSGKLNTARAS